MLTVIQTNEKNVKLRLLLSHLEIVKRKKKDPPK